MPALLATPRFGGPLNNPHYYVEVSAIVRHMRPTSTLRKICHQLNAFGYRTPTGLEFTRDRLANFIRTAIVPTAI
jgi:hypothetical protein